jgi:hypothetical protein
VYLDLVAETLTAMESSTTMLITVLFSAGVVLMASVAIATAESSPTVTIGFRLGCSVVDSAICGLSLRWQQCCTGGGSPCREANSLI